MSSEGSEETLLEYLPTSQIDVKSFLQKSNFKANELDILLSISSFNDKLNFSSVLSSESSIINFGEAKFAVNNLKTYLDNSSMRLFGDDLYLSEYSLGNMYLSIILQLIIYLTFCWMKEEFQENLMIMEDLKAYLEIYHFQKIQTLK